MRDAAREPDLDERVEDRVHRLLADIRVACDEAPVHIERGWMPSLGPEHSQHPYALPGRAQAAAGHELGVVFRGEARCHRVQG